jgi:uncharacterized protein with FMN-binding domain
MKKYFLSSAVVLLFLIYVVYSQQKTNGQTTNSIADSSPTPSSTDNSISDSSSAPVATAQPSGKFKDGQYTGPVTDAFYGNLQIKVVVSGGKVSDVKFLQYPNDRETSVQINSHALPILKQEVIASQDAEIDTVTGATQTSDAFRQSLVAILGQAKSS